MFLHKKDNGKTDEELIRLYRTDHNLEWVSALFMRYTGMVYGVCLKYLRDREESRDAVMQIHEKLINSLLHHEVSQFRGWLYVFARNHCLMQLRAKKSAGQLEISLTVMENGQSEHPAEDSDLGDDMTKLEKCIEGLNQEQQQCVRLFYLEEQSYKDIAQATGFDLNHVKSYIQNGKRNLKICMERND